MATQGPTPPTIGANLTVGEANEVAWATPENIQDEDADEATVTAATFDSPDPTGDLYGHGFGFTVPAGSTIDGILVEVNRRSIIANSGVDRSVRLTNNAGARHPTGDNKASATVWGTSAATVSYGGAADTWNAGLTVADINDADWGVRFQAQANIANADIGVAWMRVTITYTPPPAAPGPPRPRRRRAWQQLMRMAAGDACERRKSGIVVPRLWTPSDAAGTVR
jgi:hypothetical protein